MDAWAWSAIAPWLADRAAAAGRGAVLRDRRPDPRAGVVGQRGAGRAAPLRAQSRVRRRFAPHQLRHAHAVELLHEGIPLPLIQRQLGHSHLSTTGTYLEGINTEEIISTVHAQARADDARQRRPRPVANTRGSAAALPHPGPRSRAKQQSQLDDAASPQREALTSGRECCFRGWSACWISSAQQTLHDLVGTAGVFLLSALSRCASGLPTSSAPGAKQVPCHRHPDALDSLSVEWPRAARRAGVDCARRCPRDSRHERECEFGRYDSGTDRLPGGRVAREACDR